MNIIGIGIGPSSINRYSLNKRGITFELEQANTVDNYHRNTKLKGALIETSPCDKSFALIERFVDREVCNYLRIFQNVLAAMYLWIHVATLDCDKLSMNRLQTIVRIRTTILRTRIWEFQQFFLQSALKTYSYQHYRYSPTVAILSLSFFIKALTPEGWEKR